MSDFTLDGKPEEFGLFGERAITRNQPAWWDTKGTHVFIEPITVTAAFERLDMLFSISKKQAVAQLIDDPMELFRELVDKGYEPDVAFSAVLNEAFKVVPKRFALVRSATVDDPQERPYGIAGGNYTPFQNEDFAGILDKLVSISADDGDVWKLESVISLSRGTRNAVAMNAGVTNLTDDEVLKNYFVAYSDHRAGNSVRLFYAPLRPVCHNTLTMAENQSKSLFSIPHQETVLDDVKFVSQLMKHMHEQQESAVATFRAMMNTPLDKEQRNELVVGALPYRSKPARAARHELVQEMGEVVALDDFTAAMLRDKQNHEWWQETKREVDGQRVQVFQLAQKFNDEFPKAANTAWSVYNAVCEEADWRRGIRNHKPGLTPLNGYRADIKARAYTKAKEFAMVAGKLVSED